MVTHSLLSRYTRSNFAIWCALAFQSGALNAGGYLACHRFVTHVTGFATLFGTDAAQGEFKQGLGMLSVPAYFVIGAMISGFFIDRRSIQGLSPRYASVLFLIAAVNVFVLIGGVAGRLGEFGEPLLLARDYLLLALLCFVSGLQNAMITSAFGAVVRTTHLTGITTDLGMGLVRVLFQVQPASRSTELWATWMRISLIASFAMGSVVAAFIFLRHQYWGFALPSLVSITLWYIAVRRRFVSEVKR